MKTLLITAYAIHPQKGSEDGTAWNLVMQVARYHRVILVTRENNLPAIKDYLAAHEPVQTQNLHLLGFDLPYYLRFWKRGGFGALPYFYLWQRYVVGFIRRQALDFDLVHNLNFHNDWTPTFLWKLNKPLVWGPVGHHPAIPTDFVRPVWGPKAWVKDQAFWAIKRLFWRFSPALQRSIGRASAVLALNSGVEKVLPVPAHKLYRFPAVGARAQTKPSLGERSSDRFELLSVGRFVPLKGFDLALRSFAAFWHMLSPAERSGVRLTIVGKGPQEKALKQMAADLALGNSVRFIAWMPQEELMNLYQETDVFLFPSHEGAGMVIPEALSYGVPIVCLDNIGPGELVNETCALRVPYGTYQETVDGLAREVECLYRDKDFRFSLSVGAIQRFATMFDWERKGKQLSQIYSQLASKYVPAAVPESENILVAAHLLNNFTGSPLVLSHALKAMEQAGKSVHLYTSSGPGFLDELNVSRRFLHPYRWSANKYIRLLRFFSSQFHLFFRLLKYWNQPVTIYANTLLPFGAALAGKLMGKRVVYHVHETAFQPAAFTGFLKAVMRKTADTIIYVSDYLRQYHQGSDRNEQVIYNALSPEFVRQSQQAVPPTNKETFEVLMACSLKKEKGIFEYIQLAHRLPDLQFKLVISQTEAEIRQFLGSTSLPPNLTLLGRQDNMHPHYAAADLLLNLSHPDGWIETFGMTILEGMTYGLPAIVPPVGAPPELITAGEEGFLLDAREVEVVADHIWRLYNDAAQRERMAAKARDKASQFEMNTFAREIISALDQ